MENPEGAQRRRLAQAPLQGPSSSEFIFVGRMGLPRLPAGYAPK
jgi:hypothetical protein